MFDNINRTRLGLAILWLCLGAFLLLILFDGRLDLAVSAQFYDPVRGFPARADPTIVLLRGATRLTAIAVTACLLFALVYRTALNRPLFGLSRAGVVYLIAVFLLGPGLMVNGVLKEHWGRARPAQTAAFGGDRQFTPALMPAGQCDRNCSFVSGEASLGFAFVSFGFVARDRRRRRIGFIAGGVLGGAFGLIRIAQGGHFLSDVAMAGVLTVALAWLLHHVLIDRGLLELIGHRLVRSRRPTAGPRGAPEP